jgi:hypothetical protein
MTKGTPWRGVWVTGRENIPYRASRSCRSSGPRCNARSGLFSRRTMKISGLANGQGTISGGVGVGVGLCERRLGLSRTVLLICCAMSCSRGSATERVLWGALGVSIPERDTDLLNREFGHGILGYESFRISMTLSKPPHTPPFDTREPHTNFDSLL